VFVALLENNILLLDDPAPVHTQVYIGNTVEIWDKITTKIAEKYYAANIIAVITAFAISYKTIKPAVRRA